MTQALLVKGTPRKEDRMERCYVGSRRDYGNLVETWKNGSSHRGA